jgi:iron(III) transport system ATP-binding protein
MSKIAIRCQGLAKQFGEVQAVVGLNLALREGQFLALLGPSGCGKTTTLRLLAGFEVPDSGEVEIGGQLVNAPNRYVPPERRSIGMVFQEYALFPHLTVADNIAYGLPRGSDKKQRVQETLNLVGLPTIKDRMPHELSGGQQQRVALARALAPQPALILLDEPFSNLDASLRVQVRAEVRRILRQVQATAIFVTHDQEEALSLADEVAVMMGGRVVQTDTPQKLYRRPINREVATFLGDTNFLPGQVASQVVSCALGQWPVSFLHDGSVEVMVRPEDISLTPHPDGPGEVLEQQYFGHDQLIQVGLEGLVLKTRLLSSAGDFQPGQRVALTIKKEDVVLYPRG